MSHINFDKNAYVMALGGWLSPPKPLEEQLTPATLVTKPSPTFYDFDDKVVMQKLPVVRQQLSVPGPRNWSDVYEGWAKNAVKKDGPPLKRRKGRPTTAINIESINKLLSTGRTQKEVAKMCGIRYRTLKRKLKEHRHR